MCYHASHCLQTHYRKLEMRLAWKRKRIVRNRFQILEHRYLKTHLCCVHVFKGIPLDAPYFLKIEIFLL